MRRAGLIAASMVALAGCAATLPPVPGKSGPAWFELTSEHFTLWTDAGPRAAHDLVHRMERLRQIIVGVAFPGAPNGRILVVAVSDEADLSLVRQDRNLSAFVKLAAPPLYQPVIVLSILSDREDTDETVTHELSQAISFSVLHRQPRWLAEGLARYFETLKLDIDNTMVDVGVAPHNRRHAGRMPSLMPISTLFAWKASDLPPLTESRLSSTAWALFTFLVNEHRPELVRYLELLGEATVAERGLSAESERTWNQAFPSLPLTRVDDELRRWLVGGRHLVLHFRLDARDQPTTARTLSDAEVHALQGYLIADPKQEREHLAAALALEPTNVLARLIELESGNAKLSGDEGRAIVRAHPDDWRAWWLAVRAIRGARGDDPEASAAAGRACALIALNPAVIAPPNLCPVEHAQTASP